MSLQGTLETIPLADVLSLLAATKKSGELRIGGSRGDGRIWLDAGRVVRTDVPRAATPVDAVFELLRLSAGTFSFESGAVGPPPGPPVAIDALLTEAQARLDVWRAIEAVVPSMSCGVGLAPELSQDSVAVSKNQWKELVAVAGGGDVNGVMARLRLGEFETCRTVKELVDAGLAKVTPPPAAKQPAKTEQPEKAQQPEKAEQPETPERLERLEKQPDKAERQPDKAKQPEKQVQAQRPAAPTPPSREEAEELVHQLASLSKAPPRRPGPSEQAPSENAPSEKAPSEQAARKTVPALATPTRSPAFHPASPEATAAGEGLEEEPINRGMLLKFLSSVRP